ncbi:MAG: nuclear pore complex subunit [Salinivirgaceae bacterium]|nr:MAG: nuclear pore complex subunit [Salinivirgaceae bacterium]
MDNLIIKATRQSPEISLDADKGILRFVGKSRPEDAMIFYTPVIKWIKEYVNSAKPKTKIVFNLEYFNSSTTKIFKTILENFQKIILHGKDLSCDWYYEEEDEDMLEVGEELSSLYNLPFTFIPYKPD